MGYRELIEALKHEGDEKKTALLDAAKSEVERIGAECSGRIAEIEREHAERLAAAEAAERSIILTAVENEANLLLIGAERALADRLYRIAGESLHLLRDERYGELFAALAGELPAARWEKIKVSSGDRDLANRLFPDALITADPAIAGGLEAVAERGRIRVVNTLEKRLERAWPEMLPALIRAARSEYE
jgi:V/A-type H+-transporting ATPase subunit E